MKWQLANPYSLQFDDGTFNAGRVVDILTTKRGDILAGAASGGVWLLGRDGSGQPLSLDWNEPDVTCMAFGPDGSAHIFAGCGVDSIPTTRGALYVTDTLATSPLTAPWREIALNPSMGSIYKLAVLEDERRIVVACSGGLFWSAIPKPGGAYHWQAAYGLPLYKQCFSVAVGPDGSVIASVWDDDPTTATSGIYVGVWSGSTGASTDLNMTAVTSIKGASFSAVIGGTAFLQMASISLASCVKDRHSIYAACFDQAGGLYAVLRSSDGGHTWVATSTTVTGSPGGAITDAAISGKFENGGFLKQIMVSANDPNVVSVATETPLLTTDGGATWQVVGWGSGVHADCHMVYIDPTDTSSQRLLICTDGGVVASDDRGTTFDWNVSKSLANFQFYTTNALRESYGTIGASRTIEGLVGGGLQDNGNAYSRLDPVKPWHRWDGSDGGLWMPLATEQVVRTATGNPTLAAITYDASKQAYGDYTVIPVQDESGATVAPSMTDAAVEAVITPSFRNTRKQTMYGVAADTSGNIYGLFAEASGKAINFEALAWFSIAKQRPSAIASFNGDHILLATYGPAGVQCFVLATRTGLVKPAIFTTPITAAGGINRIVPVNDTVAYATCNLSQDDDHPYGSSLILRTDDGGYTWDTINDGIPVSKRGLMGRVPNEWLYGLDIDRGKYIPTIYVATDADVYASVDGGHTWRRISSGLPRRPHCADLRIADTSDSRRIYLGTYGWSMWYAELEDAGAPSIVVPPIWQQRDIIQLLGAIDEPNYTVHIVGGIITVTPSGIPGGDPGPSQSELEQEAHAALHQLDAALRILRRIDHRLHGVQGDSNKRQPS